MNKWKAVVIVAAVLLLMTAEVSAINVNIQPQAPPGLGQKLETLLGWIYYIAILMAVAGAIVGGAMLWTGRDQGKYLLVLALISLAVLAALPTLIQAI